MNNFIGGALFTGCAIAIIFLALIRTELNKIVVDLQKVRNEYK